MRNEAMEMSQQDSSSSLPVDVQALVTKLLLGNASERENIIRGLALKNRRDYEMAVAELYAVRRSIEVAYNGPYMPNPAHIQRLLRPSVETVEQQRRILFPASC